MTKEAKRVPLREFAGNLLRFFKYVVDERRTVVVENDEGERIEIRPLSGSFSKPPLTDEDYRAFRAAFGGWADGDTDRLKQAIYESRQSSRPPVSL
jgi:hypothetical protein